MRNVQVTLASARSSVEWHPTVLGSLRKRENLRKFQVKPLMATIDRRPLTVKRQMRDDIRHLHNQGRLLGCAFSTSTFVSKFQICG